MGLIRKIIAWSMILSSLLLLFGSLSPTNIERGDIGGIMVGIILFILLFVGGLKIRKEPKKVEGVPYQVEFIYCPGCNRLISSTFSNCPHCNTVLPKP